MTTRSELIQQHLSPAPRPLASDEAIEAIQTALYDLEQASDAVALFQVAQHALAAAQRVTQGR